MKAIANFLCDKTECVAGEILSPAKLKALAHRLEELAKLNLIIAIDKVGATVVGLEDLAGKDTAQDEIKFDSFTKEQIIDFAKEYHIEIDESLEVEAIIAQVKTALEPTV